MVWYRTRAQKWSSLWDDPGLLVALNGLDTPACVARAMDALSATSIGSRWASLRPRSSRCAT